MELVNKISMAQMFGNIKALVKPMTEGESKEILKIVGICNGTKQGESDFGSYTALLGEFKATNLITGKDYVSGKCFLPMVVTNLVAGQFNDEIKKVQFAFIISVVEDQSSQVGYHYTATPLMKASASDPIALLEQSIA